MKKLQSSIVCLSFFYNISFSQSLPNDYSLPLGATINLLNNFTNDHSPMLTPFRGVEEIKPIVNIHTICTLAVMNDFKDYSRVFSLDATLDGNFLWFVTGHDEFHRKTEEKQEISSTRIYFGATLNYGDRYLNKEPQLTNEAKKLLVSDQYKFTQRYGDYYISHTKLEKSIFAYIDISNLSGSQITQLSGLHQGKVDAEIFSVGTNVPVSEIINGAYKHGSCQIQYESFGYFDDQLVSKIGQAIELEKNNQNFDLLNSLQNTFLSLLKKDTSMTDYYSRPVGECSKYTSLGLSSSYYNELNRRIEKINYFKNMDVQANLLKSNFSFFTFGDFNNYIPNETYLKIKESIIDCEKLIDDNLGELKECSNADCKIIADCCNPSAKVKKQYDNLNDFRIGLNKKYTPPLVSVRSFNLNKIRDFTPVKTVNNLNTWIIPFRNPANNVLKGRGPYKKINAENAYSIMSSFSCILHVPDWTVLDNIKITGKLYNFVTNKEIPSSFNFTEFDQERFGGKEYPMVRIFGAKPITNVNDFFNQTDIGFILEISQSTPDAKVNMLSIVGGDFLMGGKPIMQGLSFYSF